MCAWKHFVLGCGVLLLLVLACSSRLHSQERAAAGARDENLPDLAKLPPFHRAVYLSSRRGAEWLWNSNRPDGLFVHGHVPALNVDLEGDSYLRQAGATLALARAARFTGNSRYAARARQAVLALLASTKTDAADPGVRFTIFPAAEVDRLTAAAYLVLAVSELPEPGQDVLEQAEQLCQFIARQQQANGAWESDEASKQQEAAAGPALALCALLRSQALQPAAWKLDAARKGLNYYRTAWGQQKSSELAPWLAIAATDAGLLTQERAFADFAFELADWMAGLQFGADPRRPLWQGGFARWEGGKPVAAAPDVGSARFAEGIVHTCRLARQLGDVQRFERYRESAERALQFLMTLQYSAASTRHFTEAYRSQLYGGFHASHQDGTLRVDYTQSAVCAMTDYLESVAQLGPQAKDPGR
jgi:hypothetical protein